MDAKHIFPLYLPGKEHVENKNQQFVVADLRQDYSTFAVAVYENGKLSQRLKTEYKTSEFSSVSDLVRRFLEEQSLVGTSKISLAVPGPIFKGKCVTPNLPWELDESTMKSHLNFKKVCLINDLEAAAYSLAEFDEGFLEILHTSEDKLRGNVAILAPGNGLGEAGLFWDGKFLNPFGTEGGHSEFSPRNDFEVSFYQFLNKLYGIVSWENVLSKKGLYDIYRFMRDVGKHPEEDWLKERLKTEDFLEVIAEVAKGNESRLVNNTVEMYTEFLAREANNLVLKLKAVGALIIMGEIPMKLFNSSNREDFYKNFIVSDRMEHLLKDIPIYLIKNPNGILDGAAYFGAFIE